MGAPTPALALPLEVTFPCRASPEARPTRHPVLISEDWSVQTPHDEGLEQIAAAFGGGVSCLPALRAVMPGFRMWWERATRSTGLLCESQDGGATWFGRDGVLPCCPPRGFEGAASAAAHSRDVQHVAAATRVTRRQLRDLVSGIGPAADSGPPGGGDALVEQSWAVGLHPDWVASRRDELAAAGHTEATVGLLIAIAHTDADVSWVAETSRHRTDPGLSEWVAWTWTALDREDPGARLSWLATGTRRADIVRLSTAGYGSAQAQEVAADWGISVPGAAQLLGRWVGCGYRPSSAQLAWVIQEGVGFPPEPPAPAAVDRVARALGRRRPDVGQRTQLAVALARFGTVPDTVSILRREGPSALVESVGVVGPPA